MDGPPISFSLVEEGMIVVLPIFVEVMNVNTTLSLSAFKIDKKRNPVSSGSTT
jgi:hypothetical protein